MRETRHRPRPTFRAAPLALAALWLLACLPAAAGPARAYGSATFPCPPQLEPRVDFWVRVFTEFSEEERIIHDVRYPWIIYEVLHVPGLSQYQIKKKVEERKGYYSRILESLARKAASQYTSEEKRVAELLSAVPETARYTRARERIRSQPGIKELFQLGLKRSGRYIDSMRAVLDSLGAPPEIAYLPHVESSFHPSAHSKAGAAGMWQFTGRTGRNYLRVEHDLDERLDPVVATGAAARYLLRAHDVLESWPLAVIAYNHGLGGMVRAKNAVGAADVVRILEEYDGPSFGFASQNFYCEFLAAMEVASNPGRYLGAVSLDPPLFTDMFPLPDYVRLPILAKAFRVSPGELAEINPALGRSYLLGSKYLPRGYRLHLPLGQVDRPDSLYVSIPAQERQERPPAPTGYKVRPGDTLSQIARRHRVSVEALRRMNNIGANARIFPGQTLVLPGSRIPGL